MAISAHITATDPLGYAVAGVINLNSYTPSTPRSYVEVDASTGLPIAGAVKLIKPLDQFDLVYDLLDTASLVVTLGVVVNTDYLITAVSCDCGAEKYPQVTLSCIKPSSAGMIKAGTSTTLTFTGGFGIVNKFGATSTSAFISSKCSVSMKSLEAMDETSGDFLPASIYRYGFKQEMSYEAYGAITAPAGAHASPNAPASAKQTADGWQIFSASFWKYLNVAAV